MNSYILQVYLRVSEYNQIEQNSNSVLEFLITNRYTWQQQQKQHPHFIRKEKKKERERKI